MELEAWEKKSLTYKFYDRVYCKKKKHEFLYFQQSITGVIRPEHILQR